MCDQTHRVNVGFMSEPVAVGAHICLVYRSESERRQIVAKFVSSGIAASERVYYFADLVKPSDVVEWLAELDVNVSESVDRADLTVSDALSAYCPDGTFLPDRMLETVRHAYLDAVGAGYPDARVTGEMSWALGQTGADRLIEYEAGVNTVVAEFPITAMCQYDANRFDGATIYRALKVHPFMVMHGQLVRNPYFAEKV